MRTRIIGIRIDSPLVKEGLKAILRSSIDNCQLSEGPWESDDSDMPDVVVSDVYNVPDLPSGVKVVGLLGSALPQRFSSVFQDTFSLYDSTADIANKINALLTSEPEEGRNAELSPREKEVILYVVRGLSNKEIASTMNVSVNTVMTHRRNIASKLKIHSPAGLTIFAIATGLVKMEEITD
ncbi:MAG: LuxR C-terminal-related transcriptional regulator [Muribaculaceae bacterium]|nr:LuxR C-terminal-related transcriptional regulator [Muribaculaceae bacterium]